ncbi:primosomal protein N' [Nakamurella antarctica]|uniref:Probable replication restart protein PriA n=1 Tax=Nakamurella antarctica TaxID=1902245 RepID=A0A3G8ZS08_9ACTN|nr:primosomal protein N' [Nakamurella antarctica]
MPVASVAVDTGLPHLDRPFDYQVSEDLAALAQPGVRVRVRFSGRLVDGYVLARKDSSDHVGKLGYLDKVVSGERVLAPEIAALARAVADRYAGTLSDILRLAIPPRHAAVEKAGSAATSLVVDPNSATVLSTQNRGLSSLRTAAIGAPLAAFDAGGWDAYTAGKSYLQAVHERKPVRAVWQALPGEDWPLRIAEAVRACVSGGRGAVVVVPDARDLARLDAAMTDVLGAGAYMALAADLGPAERYRRFLAISRGEVSVAIGTRAAAFAPVRDVGLLVIFDDGDDLFAEQRAPYPHAREVLMLRSASSKAALLVGGFARTAEAQLLVESGWAHPIEASRIAIRAAGPRIEAAGDEYARGSDSAAAHARLSPAAFDAARTALAAGRPVLIQVPRRGYLPSLACSSCRRPARCRPCRGPLGIRHGSSVPACRWCGALAAPWSCPACAALSFRAVVTGSARTAEEIGRAFAGVKIVTSAGEEVQARVEAAPALVIATPGAEPVAEEGYGAALLLDGGALLARPDLRAAEETLRRWMAAATLVRPGSVGGRVVVGADSSLPTVQALIRWDPAGHAAAELAARRELGFPPAVAMAAVEGKPAGVAAFLEQLQLPEGAELLGPVELDYPFDTERALVRIPLNRHKQLAHALHVAAAARSARKDPDSAKSRMDPLLMF